MKKYVIAGLVVYWAMMIFMHASAATIEKSITFNYYGAYETVDIKIHGNEQIEKVDIYVNPKQFKSSSKATTLMGHVCKALPGKYKIDLHSNYKYSIQCNSVGSSISNLDDVYERVLPEFDRDTYIDNLNRDTHVKEKEGNN